MKNKKLDAAFYLQADVVKSAKELIGKVLVTYFEKQFTSGIITETEAYNGVIDKASHSYGGRRTARTEIMYSEGGTAYVYLIYGIHSLFNVVMNKKNIPHAILVRAIYPLQGIEIMERRRGKSAASKNFTIGPGSVSQALGIHYSHTGLSLSDNQLYIEDHGIKIPSSEIVAGPRVGVDYAAEDALLPYRFNVKNPAQLFSGKQKNQLS